MASFVLLQYSESQRIDILKQYGKTPETVPQDIENIKQWMSEIKDIPNVTDDRLIERFLCLNGFDLDKTKNKLEMYYRIRTIIPEFYDKNPNDPKVQKIMDMVYFLPLPKLTSDLHRVIIIKAKDTNADNFDASMYLAHTLNIAEVRLREDYNLSEIHVYDLGGLQVSHLTKFTPTIIRKGTFILEKVFANRTKGLHYVNAPRFIGPFVTLLKLFLNRKLANKIFVHKDMGSLYKVIPKDILPMEYGGNEMPLDELNEEWRKKLLEYDSLFQKLRQLKIKGGVELDGPSQKNVEEYDRTLQQLTLE